MTGDPLIEPPADRPLWEGAYSAEELVHAASRIREEGAALAVFHAAGNLVAMNQNPVMAAETLALNAFGWILDHLEPLRSWLDDFTGEHETVFAYAATWENISLELGDLADTLASQIGDLDGLEGLTADAYRGHLITLADALAGTQGVATAASESLQAAAESVREVHRAIRDGISAVIVGVLESLTFAPMSGGGTLVLGPEIVTAKVSAVVVRLGPRVAQALGALARLAAAFDEVAPGLSRTLAWLSRALSKGAGVEHRRLEMPELPDAPPSDAAGGSSEEPEFRNTPAWLQRMLDRYDKDDPDNGWRRQLWEGQAFNYQEYPRYDPHNEIVLDYVADDGKLHHYRVDSYVPDADIVSRKYTQLADVSERTAKSYLDEFATKGYVPGTPIHNSDEGLDGFLYLEVPVQNEPIPREILDYADRREPPVTIRDVTGHAYN